MPLTMTKDKFQNFFTTKYLSIEGSTKNDIYTLIKSGADELNHASDMKDVRHIIDKIIANVFLCLFFEAYPTKPETYKELFVKEINLQTKLIESLVACDFVADIRKYLRTLAATAEKSRHAHTKKVRSNSSKREEIGQHLVSKPILGFLSFYGELSLYACAPVSPAILPTPQEEIILPVALTSQENQQIICTEINKILEKNKLYLPAINEFALFTSGPQLRPPFKLPTPLAQWQRNLTDIYLNFDPKEVCETRAAFQEYCQKNNPLKEHFSNFILLALLAMYPGKIDILAPYIVSSMAKTEDLEFYLDMLKATKILSDYHLEPLVLKTWLAPARNLATHLSVLASVLPGSAPTTCVCSTPLSQQQRWLRHLKAKTLAELNQTATIPLLGITGVIEAATYCNSESNFSDDDIGSRTQLHQKMRKRARQQILDIARQVTAKKPAAEQTTLDCINTKLYELRLLREACTTKLPHGTYFRGPTTGTAHSIQSWIDQLEKNRRKLADPVPSI